MISCKDLHDKIVRSCPHLTNQPGSVCEACGAFAGQSCRVIQCKGDDNVFGTIEKYAVIAPTATNRTWLDSEDEAVAHAQALIRKTKQERGNWASKQGVQRLMVVKVARVVEEEVTPPPLTVRAPRADDFPSKGE